MCLINNHYSNCALIRFDFEKIHSFLARYERFGISKRDIVLSIKLKYQIHIAKIKLQLPRVFPSFEAKYRRFQVSFLGYSDLIFHQRIQRRNHD